MVFGFQDSVLVFGFRNFRVSGFGLGSRFSGFGLGFRGSGCVGYREPVLQTLDLVLQLFLARAPLGAERESLCARECACVRESVCDSEGVTSRRRLLDSGFGFRVSGFWFRVSGF